MRSSAAWITSGSVESIWIGAGWVSDTRFTTSRHLLGLVLALGERHADVEHVRAAGHLVLGDLEDAVVVVGQQQLLGLARALRVHALADERGPRLLHQRRGGHHRGDERRAACPGAAAASRPPTRSTIAAMWSGVVPQQPPTMETP